MMKGPHKLLPIRCQAQESEPHRGGLGKIQASRTIPLEVRLESLVGGTLRQMAPVFADHLQRLRGGVHNLNRPIQYVPNERSTQNGMAVHHALPGAPEMPGIEISGDRVEGLNDVLAFSP